MKGQFSVANNLTDEKEWRYHYTVQEESWKQYFIETQNLQFYKKKPKSTNGQKCIKVIPDEIIKQDQEALVFRKKLRDI